MAPTGVAVVFQIGSGKRGQGVEAGRRNFKQPRGLALCADGSLLVSDFANNCVLRFKPGERKGKVVAGESGKALPDIDPMKDIDKAGPVRLPDEEGYLLKQPCDVFEDSEGRVLVLDTEEASIQRFAKGQRTHTLLPVGGKTTSRSLGSPDSVKGPRAFLLAPDGALVICDSWSHRVLRYPPPDSPQAAEPPTVLAGAPNSWGTRADQLAFPSAACFLSDGALLVSDTNNHRVQRFLPGELQGVTVAGSATGERGSGLGELDMPTGICADPRGGFLVADRANSRLLRFPAGSTAGTAGEIVAGGDILQRPWGVCISPDGGIFVSDDRGSAVFLLAEDGHSLSDAWAAVSVPEPEPREPEEPAPPSHPAPELVVPQQLDEPAATQPESPQPPPPRPAAAAAPATPQASPPELPVAEVEAPSVQGHCMDMD